MSKVYTFALKNTLGEIKNACPNISNTFIFREDAKILAKDETTDEETIIRAAYAFNALAERADTIGGIESATFYGTNNRMNIACINDFYLAAVASKETDEKQVNILTRVLVPTVLRLADRIQLESKDDNSPTKKKPKPSDEAADDTQKRDKHSTEEETEAINPESAEESETNPDLCFPEPPVTQFMVEGLDGLLVRSNKVRIDNAVILQWTDLYGDKEITEVDIETLNGQTTRCRFKPIKGSKREGKGILQMPEKIRLTLQTSIGELVTVKPVIE